MCGIAGALGIRLDADVALRAMAHRGPDATGVAQIGPVQLLHARLSIIDLAGGVQPMQRGPLTIVFNGEIYNHRELRQQHALDCRSGSDTETLLAMIERFGLGALEQLDGMFAFALHDAAHDRLWLARDRAGEKPLYLWSDAATGETAMAFASELNTLAACLPLEVDEQAVNGFLSSGSLYGAATAYRQVEEVGAGCTVQIDCITGARHTERWFGIDGAASSSTSFSDVEMAMQAVEQALSRAVRRSLLAADVEVGAFLSGGIDSGLICALAAGHSENLRTFTVGFDGQFDETPLARSVASRYGLSHTRLDISLDRLPDEIESIILGYGEPVADSSIVPVWYVSRAAREHVKVVLTGDGADEQFAGYRRYVPYAHANLFSRADGSTLARALHSRLPRPARKQSLYNYAWRLLQLSGRGGLQRYLSATTGPDPELLAAPAVFEPLRARYEELANSDRSSLARIMAMDFDALLTAGYLPKVDIGSMAHSLETRAPFLARDVIAAASGLSDRLKIRGRTTKFLLRELARRHLPDEVRLAPKRGFESPVVAWLAGPLRDSVHDRLGNPNAWVRSFCREGALDALLEARSRHSPLERANLLWGLYCTEVWHAGRPRAASSPVAAGRTASRHAT